MLQLLQESVRGPKEIADINPLPIAGISREPDGAVRIGALTRLEEAAGSSIIREHFAVVAEALDATASPMMRHMATAGGNLLQRTHWSRQPMPPIWSGGNTNTSRRTRSSIRNASVRRASRPRKVAGQPRPGEETRMLQ